MKVYLETEDIDLGYNVTAVYKCLEDIPYPIEQGRAYKTVWKHGRATADIEDTGPVNGVWHSVEKRPSVYKNPLYTIYEYEVK
jgi:hypothetical protein